LVESRDIGENRQIEFAIGFVKIIGATRRLSRLRGRWKLLGATHQRKYRGWRRRKGVRLVDRAFLAIFIAGRKADGSALQVEELPRQIGCKIVLGGAVLIMAVEADIIRHLGSDFAKDVERHATWSRSACRW
jgi:hypothetical protein